MRRVIAGLTLAAFCLCLFGCTAGEGPASSSMPQEASSSVQLEVVTSFGSGDGNHQIYVEAYQEWERQSGHTVHDMSATMSEEWRSRVVGYYETGSQPDVLFFFTGVIANAIVQGDFVVPLEEIRAEYPAYASNMEDELIPASPYNGVRYAVPTTGYWESLYVNNDVLRACGLAAPDETTTWEEFLVLCAAIQEAGYTPIALSLAGVPHYWFEYCVLNNGGPAAHNVLPQQVGDGAYNAWVGGLADMLELYHLGFLPENTLTATDDEIHRQFLDGEAAFSLDGSWRLGWFEEAGAGADITLTYVPGTQARPASEIIGGLSMGYYISRSAWEDETKRDAAVSFVQAMTRDEVVQRMAAGAAVTALKEGTRPLENATPLALSALEVTNGATGLVPAAQDELPIGVKDVLLQDIIQQVMREEMTPEEAVELVMEMLDNG